VLIKNPVNEAGGLKLVQLPYPDAEHIVGSGIHLALVELMLVHELEDEILLFAMTFKNPWSMKPLKVCDSLRQSPLSFAPLHTTPALFGNRPQSLY
jgi:hypothetical protein